MVEFEPVSGTIADQVDPPFADLSISYPVTVDPPFDDGGFQDRLICEEDIAVATRPVGGDGGTDAWAGVAFASLED